jgi:hypothetical protein
MFITWSEQNRSFSSRAVGMNKLVIKTIINLELLYEIDLRVAVTYKTAVRHLGTVAFLGDRLFCSRNKAFKHFIKY